MSYDYAKYIQDMACTIHNNIHSQGNLNQVSSYTNMKLFNCQTMLCCVIRCVVIDSKNIKPRVTEFIKP